MKSLVSLLKNLPCVSNNLKMNVILIPFLSIIELLVSYLRSKALLLMVIFLLLVILWPLRRSI